MSKPDIFVDRHINITRLLDHYYLDGWRYHLSFLDQSEVVGFSSIEDMLRNKNAKKINKENVKGRAYRKGVLGLKVSQVYLL